MSARKAKKAAAKKMATPIARRMFHTLSRNRLAALGVVGRVIGGCDLYVI